MIEKTTKKETLPEIFNRNNAVISMNTKNGYANISFDKSEIKVKFLNEDGYQDEDMEMDIIDIQKVGKFMEDLKSLKLNEWSK